LGPNGSGKTTTLKCIAGLLCPTSGTIRIDGKPVSQQALDVRRLFSYLPQRVSFPDSLTAREVINFYCQLRKLPADATLRALHNSNLDGFGDKPLSEYSGGMIQRLGVAMALGLETPLVLLDEPTAGLDPHVSSDFRDRLVGMRDRGYTVVFTSHMLAEVERVADRVAILLKGRLVALESIKALRARMPQVLHIHTTGPNISPELCNIALAAGAINAEIADGVLSITSSVTTTVEIVSALDAAGARIARFSTREPSLEELYFGYIHENPDPGSSAVHNELPVRSVATGSH
jgi:ABC-type multidrug transport system ATPase subunit